MYTSFGDFFVENSELGNREISVRSDNGKKEAKDLNDDEYMKMEHQDHLEKAG